MNILNELIKRTKIYKEQEGYTDRWNEIALKEQKEKYKYKELYQEAKNERIEIEKDHDALVDEIAEHIKKHIKLLKKIRTHVNKLDKKDENVKEIKRLIKEVL